MTRFSFVVSVAATAFACQAGIASSTVMDIQQLRKLFAHPPRMYSSGPLWVWNDHITDEEVVRTLHELAEQHIRQVWIHPRPGLMTPYLSDEWFRLWSLALAEAKKLDMNVWIYDENSYPSGFAGGLVPEAMPESRGQGLLIQQVDNPTLDPENLVAVYRLEGHRYENVTADFRRNGSLPPGRYIVCKRILAPERAWHGGKYYVDLLRPGVTEKFIDITLEAYRRHFGDDFGTRIPGTFTDEPQIRPAGGLPWTPDLPDAFQKRWNYNLLDRLPELEYPLGNWTTVRHNYYQLLCELFSRRWGKPMHDYCEKHKLAFTGHYWEHEWPTCLRVPDNMAAYSWHQVPAIDTLFNRYSEDPHAQFGNVRAVRELASVANQLGRTRTLCEAYGASGWDLRLEDMKRIGDWLYALGVNTLNQHLSFISIRGARKYDHPTSFSYHAPWWEAYHRQADYFARLSLMLAQGRQINQILVIEPTTTAWMYQTHAANDPNLVRLGRTFQSLVTALDQAQVEYDLGSEDILARFGKVAGADLHVGQARYRAVVIPPFTENLNFSTVRLLASFLVNGGTVICCGPAPVYIDGRPSGKIQNLTNADTWVTLPMSDPDKPLANLPELIERTRAFSDQGVIIERDKHDAGLLYHHRRQLVEGQLLFLANTSLDHPTRGRIRATAGAVEEWNPLTGEITPRHFTPTGTGLETDFDLPPGGSLLLFLPDEPDTPPPPAPKEIDTPVAPQGELIVTRDAPNVLVLDYLDVTSNGQYKKHIYAYLAADFAFQANGLKANPWDRAVQLRDTLISHSFTPDSTLQVDYQFTIEGPVPQPLTLVVERPDLYDIACNGHHVTPTPGAWWLDRSFGCIDITAQAKTGHNTITLQASPFTMFHEVQAVYILGDFTLQAADHGFTIHPARPLGLGPWNTQGHPLYGHSVTYTRSFKIQEKKGRYVVVLPAWNGTVAKVSVNGAPAGYIDRQPYECDVTRHVVQGLNTIAVTVVGSLRNILGPFHNNPPAGIAGPGHFRNAPETGPPPGKQYSTVGYGLFEPFTLRQRTCAPGSQPSP